MAKIVKKSSVSAPVVAVIEPAVQEQIDEYKVMFRQAQGRVTTLLNDALAKLCLSLPEEIGEEQLVSLMLAMENPNEPRVLPDLSRDAGSVAIQDTSSLSSAQEARAKEVAVKLSNDAELSGFIAENIAATEIKARGPFDTLLAIQRLLGDDNFKVLPQVGSGADDKDTGNKTANADIYWIKKPKVNGGTRLERRSFMNHLADNLPEGVVIQQELAAFDAAKDGQGKYAKLSKGDRIIEEKVWSGKQGTLRTLIRSAVDLGQQIARIKALPMVQLDTKIDVLANGHKVSKKVLTPFCLWGKVKNADGSLSLNSEEWDKFGVKTLLNIDVPAAVEKDGGTWSSLKATLERETETPKQDVPAISDEKTFEKYVAEIAAALDPDSGIYRAVILGLSNAKVDDAYILSIGDAAQRLEWLTEKVQVRYDQLSSARASAKAAAHAATKAAENKAA